MPEMIPKLSTMIMQLLDDFFAFDSNMDEFNGHLFAFSAD